MRLIRLSRGLVLVLTLTSLCAHAGALTTGPGDAWPGWRWGPRQDVDLPGVRLTQHPFEADSPPAQSARRLAGLRDMVFDRLAIIEGGIVLSGVRDGAHWFGWLRPGARGTRGMVSVLTPIPTSGQGAGVPLPAGVRALTRVTQREGAARLTIASHAHPDEAAGLRPAIRRLLVHDGWRPAEAGWPGGEAWRRPGAFLQVRIQPQGSHSIIWTWYREGDEP